MQPIIGEFAAMNNRNSLLNQHQIPALQEIHNHGQPQTSSSPSFDPTSSQDDFLEQMLSSVPSAGSSFPWVDEQSPSGLFGGHLEEQSAAVLASKMRQHQISSGAARALMLQQQLLLSRSLGTANGLRPPTGAEAGFIPMPLGEHNDVVDGGSFKTANSTNDASVKSLFNGIAGSLGQTLNPQPQHFNHSQAQNFASPAAGASPGMSQPAASGGAVAGQQKPRVRARRGQATDPHSIAERLRRERIAERMKALQELVPNANKTDKASMLDEIVDYVKFLQLQVKVLSMSRLGGAAAVAPLVADTSSEGRSIDGTQTASSSQNDSMKVAEQQVAKLMEEDMGSAMQYLQGKGLCLMPVSLATAISATRPPSNHPLLNAGDAAGPTSPSLSVLTVQSAATGEPNSVSKP
ncbi:hypothetical protein CDL12_06740 [Handroanthus impetiginosus]|uniref:BHLH domain-containing protein n=1 Tax=Handroanthus impetiginosus TaxID=429701 RepID=A0A2G9HSS0_9LAMI|nr:hypothetical protein CDL12_06740 [Handroanthus impetiginosus]